MKRLISKTETENAINDGVFFRFDKIINELAMDGRNGILVKVKELKDFVCSEFLNKKSQACEDIKKIRLEWGYQPINDNPTGYEVPRSEPGEVLTDSEKETHIELCPFCGGIPFFSIISLQKEPMYSLMCSCRVGQNICYSKKEDAIKAWNKRV